MRQLEHQQQAALFRWAAYQVKARPELALMFAIPNGGLRSKATAGKLKAEGVKAGVPDIFLPVPSTSRGVAYSGLWIEMKAGRNIPTVKQNEWRVKLSQQGYRTVVCWSWESARDVIEEYLGG